VGEGRRDCRNSFVQQKLVGIFWNLHAHELSPVHAQAWTLVLHSETHTHTHTHTHWVVGQLKHIESGKEQDKFSRGKCISLCPFALIDNREEREGREMLRMQKQW